MNEDATALVTHSFARGLTPWLPSSKGRPKTLAGERHNLLTAIELHHKRGHAHFWKFRCDCGGEKIILASTVRQGKTKDCGCVRRKYLETRPKKCRRCDQPKVATEYRWIVESARRSCSCIDCEAECENIRKSRRTWRSAEGKREVRRLAAERAGRHFVPGVPWLSGNNSLKARLQRTRPKVKLWNSRDISRLLLLRAAPAWFVLYSIGVNEERPWRMVAGTTDQYRVRYAHDPAFVLRERMRAAMNRAKGGRYGKKIADLIRPALVRDGQSPTVQRLLGFTIDQLKRHLERQFSDGMSWEAFAAGRIHIDHIRPLSMAENDPDHWRELWALPNLQPLWAKQNLTKSNKRSHLI